MFSLAFCSTMASCQLSQRIAISSWGQIQHFGFGVPCVPAGNLGNHKGFAGYTCLSHSPSTALRHGRPQEEARASATSAKA